MLRQSQWTYITKVMQKIGKKLPGTATSICTSKSCAENKSADSSFSPVGVGATGVIEGMDNNDSMT